MKTDKFVLPSGVSCVVTVMNAGHLRKLSQTNGETGALSGTEAVLQDCIIGLGAEDAKPDQKIIKNMFSVDRKVALWRIRQLTHSKDKDFKFEYPWPVSQGGRAQKTPHSILLDEENFPVKKAAWVEEKIEDLLRQAEAVTSADIWDKEVERARIGTPQVYDTYEEMLQARQVYFVEHEGSKFQLTIPNGHNEYRTAKINPATISDHTIISIRDPKRIIPEDGDRVVSVNLDTLDADTYFAIRNYLRRYEPEFNTTVRIEHPNNGQSKAVNVLAVADFFYPSNSI